MSLAAGSRLGPYEILSAIGAGGMGEVYRARDTKLNRDVALKVLPESFATDPDRLARFQREAQVLASLNHPNIAHIHGLEDSGGVRALVMELVEGEDLAQRLTRGPIPIDEALPIAKQIAEALESAHEQGIIHRDLKPANIKVRADGTVKVLDFGLAKAMEPVGVASASVSMSPTITTPAMMTGAGMILGTAAYMSPEQAKGRPADKRSDIWSSGCVLFEMLTGARPFVGEDVADTLAHILTKEPEWAKLPASTPPPISRLLRRCLEKDRKRRLADAADARLEIEDVLSGRVEIALRERPARRKAIAWGVAGLALAAAAGLAPWYLAKPPATVPVVASQFLVPAPEHLEYSGVPAISPDGRTIAFIATESDGRSRLWVRRLDLLAAQALAGTEGAAAPFWSPDSRAVGFFVRGELKKVDVEGGAPQVVAATSSRIQNTSGSWNRDGVILFSRGTDGFRKVSATGGDVSSVSPGSYPFFLPDGQHFLLWRRVPQSGIYVGALDSPDVKFLVPTESAGTYAEPGFLLFSRGEALMAQPFDPVSLTTTGSAVHVLDFPQVRFGVNRQVVSAAMNGTLLYGWRFLADTRLQWVDRRGTPGPFATDPGQYGNVVLSPDGVRVAFDRLADGGSSPDVWLLDLTRHITSKFTFGPANNVPVWSPDSRTVAFATSRRKRPRHRSAASEHEWSAANTLEAERTADHVSL